MYDVTNPYYSLGGTFQYDSQGDSFTLTAQIDRISTPDSTEHLPVPAYNEPAFLEEAEDRPSILVYGHDQGIIFSIANLFSDNYDIKLFSSPHELIKQVKNDTPEVIIIEEVYKKNRDRAIGAGYKRR